jgi:hypothetical protein
VGGRGRWGGGAVRGFVCLFFLAYFYVLLCSADFVLLGRGYGWMED